MATKQFAGIKSFSQTPTGSAALKALIAAANNSFPQYMLEVQGMADGAASVINASFNDLFIFNAYDELQGLMSPGVGEGGCSDVLRAADAPGEQPRTIAHNEDARPWNAGILFMLDGAIGDDAPFTVYSYPGMLPTGAFGYRPSAGGGAGAGAGGGTGGPGSPGGSGLFLTLNGVFPLYINTSNVPRAFLHRSLLESSDLDDAVARAVSTPVACGFSVNMGVVGDARQRLVNVEVSAQGLSSVQWVTSGSSVSHYYHTNSYLRVKVPQQDDVSSDARLARFALLPVPTPAIDATFFTLLGDTGNTSWPVYRTATPPDDIATMITAVFTAGPSSDGGGGEVGNLRIWASNPKMCSAAPIWQRSF